MDPTTYGRAVEGGGRWRCPNCHDDMTAKFRRSHERLCPALSRIEALHIDYLLLDLVD